MNGRRGFFVAGEGIPFLLLLMVLAFATWYLVGPVLAVIPFALFVWLYLIFHDPHRASPSVALGVFSPVDGTVVEVAEAAGIPEGRARKIKLKVNSLGTYTARCPVEGKIMDLHGLPRQAAPAGNAGGLWIVTDEGENVVLQFHGNRFGFAPRAFMRYGERVGQGQRCAYMRLTRYAEVLLPPDARVLVSPGQRVTAGEDLLAKLSSA